MRLLRLCENEGRLDFGAYLALRESVTIREALEIETALCVIGDRREEYSDFRRTHKPNTQTMVIEGQHGAPARAPEGMRQELAHRRASLERDRGALMRHRAAIAYAASGQVEPPGRLTPAGVQAAEQAIRSHTEIVDYLARQLEEIEHG